MEHAKLTIHVAVSATPDPAPVPTTPSLFTEYDAAVAHMDESLRMEWEAKPPEDDETGEPLPYPDDWEEAHDALAAQNDGKDLGDELWGEHRLSSTVVDVPLTVAVPRGAYDSAIGALRELVAMAENAGVATPRQASEAIEAADALDRAERGE